MRHRSFMTAAVCRDAGRGHRVNDRIVARARKERRHALFLACAREHLRAGHRERERHRSRARRGGEFSRHANRRDGGGGRRWRGALLGARCLSRQARQPPRRLRPRLSVRTIAGWQRVSQACASSMLLGALRIPRPRPVMPASRPRLDNQFRRLSHRFSGLEQRLHVRQDPAPAAGAHLRERARDHARHDRRAFEFMRHRQPAES